MTTALPTELPADEVDQGGFEPPTRGFPCRSISHLRIAVKLSHLDSNQEPDG
jgi:hypothetical protein